MNDSEILFTPASLLDLLSQIDALAGLDLSLTETLDGELQLIVGEDAYLVPTNECATDVQVDEDVVEEIAEVNETAYAELGDDFEVTDLAIVDEDGEDVAIEGGILKEFVKTLAVGGVVRLGKELLTH